MSDTTDYVSRYEEAKARVDCKAHRIEVRQRINRGGQVTWWEQCATCGAKFRNLKACEVPAPARTNPTAYDEDLNASYHRRISEEQQKHYEAAKKKEKEAWWRWYNAYLQSPEWARKRDKVLKRANGLCEGCGEAKAIQVHHKTYDRVGQEMLFDLVAVCTRCHEAIHQSGAA